MPSLYSLVGTGVTIVRPYTYRPLTAEDGTAWATLRMEGARDFPLGFLITADEAESMTSEKARSVLSNGTTRGVFDGPHLVGYCGLRRETLERTRQRWSGFFDQFAASLSSGMGFMSGGGFQVQGGGIIGLSWRQQPMR